MNLFDMKDVRDLTEDEEASLPLPKNWIRTIKISLGQSQHFYKNVISGLESQEHPFILQALNNARRKTLPVGWSVKEVIFDDGSKDYSYFNAELGISMWDPPQLRECLFECLLANGFDPSFLNFGPHQSENYDAQQIQFGTSQNIDTNNTHEFYNDQHNEHDADFLLDDLNNTDYSREEKYDISSHQQLNTDTIHSFGAQQDTLPPSYQFNQFVNKESMNPPPVIQVGFSEDGSVDDLHPPGVQVDQQPLRPLSRNAPVSQNMDVNHSRDWGHLLEEYTDRNSVFTDKISHRVTRRSGRPPVTLSGIRVLRSDVEEANERIHQLISKLRTVLSQQAGIECSFLYTDDTEQDGSSTRNRSLVTLASDIVTSLRQRPEFIVMAMATTNKSSSSAAAMVQIAFTALHRLLHPFSTDNSMTTAILLQGINYQLDEMTQVEQLFSSRDSRRILSRALLVSDPVEAMAWDPLKAPLPVVPAAVSETVLTCLLRLYAIRRDVTSYYRTIWKPMVPAIIAVLNVDECRGPHVFGNLLAVANRLLECTLSTRSMIVFPATATAICRAMHEIGGALTMHAYLFNLLILPNLVKVLAGDHESTENECLYPLDKVQGFVDKYFDQSLWFSADSAADSKSSRSSFNPLRSLIWAVWRLYTHAVYLPSMALTTLTAAQFAAERLPGVDLSGVPDSKLRNVIARLTRKINRGCEYLLKLPLDAQGSEYLGVDPSVTSGACLPLLTNDHQPEMTKLLDKRLSTLHFKPNEMLNLTVVSRQDVDNLFTDIGVAMELSGQAQGSSLYQGISEYLHHSQDSSLDLDSHDELLLLVFLYDHSAESEELSSQEEVATRHKQLLRGLTLQNRYEDLLIQLIDRAQQRATSTIFDLVAPPDEVSPAGPSSQSHAPEFDTQFKSDSVRLAQLHTVGSSNKAKQSHFGLNEPQHITAYPLFSKHASIEHQHPDVKSLAELNNEYFASYRFGSTAPSVAVGTSLARPKVNAPKLKANAVNVTTATVRPRANSSQRSRYTKMHIKPDANILVPTESTKSQQSKKSGAPDTLQAKDKHFMQSMREHKVIPADQFRQGVEQRRAHFRSSAPRAAHPNQSKDETPAKTGVGPQRSQHNVNNLAIAPVAAPQPFPEHLRHRVRGEEGDAARHLQTTPPNTESTPRVRSQKTKKENYAAGGSSKDVIAKIIREYQQVFPASTPPSRNYQISDLQYGMATGTDGGRRDVSSSAEGPVITRTLSRTASGSRLVHKRAKSPSLPEPIRGGSRFSAPTQNLLRKMEADSGVDILNNGSHSKTGGNFENLNTRFMQEVHAGIMPGLRSYKSSSEFTAPAFVPTTRRIYAPSGARAPRVPDFLVNGANSRGNSRPSSRTSSPSVRSRQRQQQQQQYETHDPSRGYHNGRDSDEWYFNGHQQNGEYNEEDDDQEEDYEVNDFYSAQYRDDGIQQPTRVEPYQHEEEYYSDQNRDHGSEMDDEPYDQQRQEPFPPTTFSAVGDNPLSFRVDYDDASSKFVLNRPHQELQQQQLQPLQQQQHQQLQHQQKYEQRHQQRHQQQQQQSRQHIEQREPLSQRPGQPEHLPYWDNINRQPVDQHVQAEFSPIVAHFQEQEEARADLLQPPPTSSLRDNSTIADHQTTTSTKKEFATVETQNRDRLLSSDSNATSKASAISNPMPTLAPVGVVPFQLATPMSHQRQTESSSVVSPTATAPRPVRRNYSAEELYNAQQSPKQAEREAALANGPLPPVSAHSVLGGKSKPPVVYSQSIPSESVLGDSRAAVASQPIASPVMASVTPLKLHTSYSINFEEAQQSDEQDRHNSSHIYDTNADREYAVEMRRGGLCGSSSDEDSWGEDDGQRYIKDVLKTSRTRFDESGRERVAGRVPLIKKKSLIPGREDSRDFLIKGFQATKHGRSGAPKQKFIVFKPEDNVIEWTANSKGRLGGFTSFFSSSGGGAAAVKEATSSISLDSILEVRRGIQTDVLKKAGLVDPFCCFSIVTKDRTLDITMTSALARDMAIRGLQMLLEYDSKVRFL